MCGICGIFCLDGEGLVEETTLRAMTAAQRHRGPDDQGYLVQPGAGLGFCRLAIIDLTPAGHQPMTNEDSTIWIMSNGEIYNFQELVPPLERAGHCFRSRSDSEVLVHAYEEWGIECLERLNGMFALAIWDSRRRRAYIARDRLGVKPLYYWSNGTHFAFASELKALLQYPAVSRDIDLHALQTYLAYEYIPTPASIFRHIQKLPPAHFLEIPLDGSSQAQQSADWSPQRYWQLHYRPAGERTRRVEEYQEELHTLLRAAVKRRLISDVPLGVFLSGGTDSSSITAMMAEASTRPIKTFSIGFAEKSFNELHYARLIARHFHTEHHEEILNPDIPDLFQSVVDVLDEPFADASVLPSYLVAQTARKQVTVVLTGDGGDEMFAGYDFYRAQRFAAATVDHLPNALRRRLGELAAQIPHTAKKKGLLNSTRRFLDGACLPATLQHTRWQTFWHEPEMAQLLAFSEHERIAVIDAHILDLFKESGSHRPLDQQQYVDIKRYLADDILFKVDRMTMVNSLEARSPFLDYTIAEFAAQLPPSLRLHHLEGKYLLKRMISSKLPYETLHRPKLGFNIPYKLWLRRELRPLLLDALAPSRLQQQGLFQPRYVQRLLHEHLEGIHDHAHKLWQLLMFQLWAERYLSNVPAPVAQSSLLR